MIDQDEVPISEEIPPAPGRPMPDDGMFYGVFKEVVDLLAQHSEADPMSHLATLYSYVGCMAGREYSVSRKPLSVWPVTVGDASYGRKGTGKDDVLACFNNVDVSLLPRVTPSAVSESGLVHEVRDKSERRDKDDKPVDMGVEEKRLWVNIPEFGKVFHACKVPGANLQEALCSIYDGDNQRVSTSKGVLAATRPMVVLNGNVTGPMFAQRFDSGALSGGILTRIMPIFVDRVRLYRGLEIPDEFWRECEALGLAIAESVNCMREKVGKNSGATSPMHFDEEVQEWWRCEGHERMTTDPPGLTGFGKMFSGRRGDNFKRIAGIIALTDKTDVISMAHVKPALRFVDYSTASVGYAETEYGFATVADSKTSGLSPKARKFREYVERQMNAGASCVSRTEIYTEPFGRNTPAAELDLIAADIPDVSYVKDKMPGAQRATKLYFITTHPNAPRD